MNNVNFVFRYYFYTLILTVTLIFVLCVFNLKPYVFLTFLNSLFLGVVISQFTVFAQFLFYTMFVSKESYSAQRQWIFSSALDKIGYVLIVTYSLTHRSGPIIDAPVDWQLLLSRYIVIIATILQVFAPDIGERFFYGVNRKIAIGGLIAGLLLAVTILILKFSEVATFPLGNDGL